MLCVNSKQIIFYLLARSCTEFNSGTTEMIVLFVKLKIKRKQEYTFCIFITWFWNDSFFLVFKRVISLYLQITDIRKITQILCAFLWFSRNIREITLIKTIKHIILEYNWECAKVYCLQYDKTTTIERFLLIVCSHTRCQIIIIKKKLDVH